MTPNEVANIAREAARSARTYARPNEDHVSLGGPLRVLILVVIAAVGAGIGFLSGMVAGPFVFGAFVVLGLWAHRIPRIGAQWEQAVILRFGRFHRVAGPGVFLVFPIADYARFVDTRLLTLEIPHQQVITRDNVPVAVDGVLFFRVVDTQAAVIGMQDYRFAISQYAQASLRDVIGAMTLDELLSEREQIQERIEHVVEERIKAWGIHVDSIRLLDIDMPEELKKMMSRQASAEREKRATITKAEGDKLAAFNLAEAAATMSASPGAMQLRGLQTLDGLGASPSNTVVLAVPVEIYEGLRRLAGAAPTAG
jgi:regulator of protease activity HflC (stomatin/prohibitin superfamily)